MKIVVNSTGECPIRYCDGQGFGRCGISHGVCPGATRDDKPPADCPLRKGPVTVRLEKEVPDDED